MSAVLVIDYKRYHLENVSLWKVKRDLAELGVSAAYGAWMIPHNAEPHSLDVNVDWVAIIHELNDKGHESWIEP
jgi:hypothetical protein